MCGWFSCEAAWASTRNRAIWRGSMAAANGRTFSATRRPSECSHGLVDDAHAAAAQLAQNLEIAELGAVAARRCRRPSASRVLADRAGPDACRPASSHQVQAPQAGAEPLGDRRMPPDPLLGIHRPAGLDLGEVGVEHLRQLVCRLHWVPAPLADQADRSGIMTAPPGRR